MSATHSIRPALRVVLAVHRGHRTAPAARHGRARWSRQLLILVATASALAVLLAAAPGVA